MQVDPKLERQALALPIGHKRKILHCGSSPSMSMSAKLKGIHLYCHRCGYSEWVHRDLSSISIAQLDVMNVQKGLTRECALPSDFSTDFTDLNDPTSAAALVWYAKSGITDRLRREYSLGWSKKYGRAVIPVYSGTKLTAVVYRRLHMHDQNRAKYVCFGDGTAASSVFISKAMKSARDSEAFLNLRSSYRIVFVEDALSAIRLGEYVLSGSLLGTSSSEEKVQRLLLQSGSSGLVGIWLDPDQAGTTGARKLQRYLALQGIEARTILSHKDPKALSDREIIRRLSLDEQYDRFDLAPDYEDPRRVQ